MPLLTRKLIASSGHVEHLNALNFRLEKTGSQGALSKLFPETRVSAQAYHVPLAVCSVSDITCKPGKEVEEEAVREILGEAADNRVWEIVESIRSSAALLGNPFDAIVARDSITVIDGDLVRLRSGYDNAYGPARSALDAMAFIRQRG